MWADLESSWITRLTARRARRTVPFPHWGQREGNAVHEGPGETRPRTGWIAEDRTHAHGASRVDARERRRAAVARSQRRRAVDREREPLPTRVRDTLDLPAAYDHAVQRGLDQLGLDVGPDARATINGHVRLLLAWTSAINLTGIRDPAAVGTAHVIDSLSAVPWLRGRDPDRLLDLGSGGGFPGLPIAAVLPDVAVTLVEPVAKKARFLSTMVVATGMAGRVTITTDRAEALAADRRTRARSSVVTARAVATLADLVELAFPLLESGGALVAWKRGDLEAELGPAWRAITALGGGRVDVVDVRVDGLIGHRLVVIERTGTVPAEYPRDPAARKRRPW